MVDLLENTQLKWNETLEENERLKTEINVLKNKSKIEENIIEDLDSSDCFIFKLDSSRNILNENKKRKKVNFRRSSSLPARNEVF